MPAAMLVRATVRPASAAHNRFANPGVSPATPTTGKPASAAAASMTALRTGAGFQEMTGEAVVAAAARRRMRTRVDMLGLGRM